MNRMQGNTALVTGGSAGIGLAIAERLAADGARVIIVGRRKDALADAVARIGHDAVGLACDVTVAADLDRVFGTIKADFGGLDAVVINAGGVGGGPLESCTEAAFDSLFDLNVKSVFFTAQGALPLLRSPSSLVLIGSIAGEIVVPHGSVYAASKAALRQFVRCWAEDLAPRGVRVHLLAPGYTETPLFDRITSTPESAARFAQMVTQRTSLKRPGRPEEIASVAAFLCSEESSYMTGGAIYAGGGGENW